MAPVIGGLCLQPWQYLWSANIPTSAIAERSSEATFLDASEYSDNTMNIEAFRDYCLAMDGVTEKTPFGKFSPRFDSILVFYVLDHMFCMADIDDFSSVSFRSTPEEIGEIKTQYMSAHNPPNQAMKFWISVNLNEDMPDSEIYSYIRRAYETVRDKYTNNRKKAK